MKNCKGCGYPSIDGEERCPDCRPIRIEWPDSTWFQKRLKELKEKEKRDGQKETGI